MKPNRATITDAMIHALGRVILAPSVRENSPLTMMLPIKINS